MKRKFKKSLICTAVSACMLANGINAMDPGGISVSAQYTVFINEICAKNTTYAASNGGYYDWIELYNPSDADVDLSNWGLSDDPTGPYRFTFTQGAVIPAQGFLLVFCDSSAVFTSDELLAPFGLSTSGESLTLTDADGTCVDYVEFGEMEADITYGRYPDASSSLYKMEPTPMAKNLSENVIIDVSEPVFSSESGFYDSSFILELTADPGLTIYYTTDGSDPTTSSNKYSAKISVQDRSSSANVYSAITEVSTDQISVPNAPVDKAAVIRAVCVDSNGNYSDIVTKTYFIGFNSSADYYDNMKVISLITDPDNLFDSTTGIYVKGDVYNAWRNSSEYDPNTNSWEMPANYMESGREWERPATMQVFDNGELAFSQDIGIRIHGGASRCYPQKSFNIYARSDYGETKMKFDFYSDLFAEFDGSKIEEFDSIMLRNGGNDMMYMSYRDMLIQTLSKGRDFAVQAQTPCVVFIDGEYWGHYFITEKLSSEYIESHFGVKAKNVAMIKNNELEEGEAQDLADFTELVQTVKGMDMSLPENYEYFCSQFDVDSFIDYMCVNTYIANVDWPHNNWAVWRSNAVDDSNPYSDGKWRMILFDTEYSTGLYESTDSSYDSFSNMNTYPSYLYTLFNSLIQNDDFKEQFCITFMDIANVNFENNYVQSMISSYESEMKTMIYDTWLRFYCTWLTTSWAPVHRAEQLQILCSFFEGRFYPAAASMNNALDIGGTLNKVTLNGNPSEGNIKLNTVTPDISSGSWSGMYYSSCPITVTALPVNGAEFSHWEISGGRFSSGYYPTDLTVSVDFSASVTITAVYGDCKSTVIGDANHNFCFDTGDYPELNAYLLSYKKFNQTQYSLTDINSDGITNVVDLLAQKQMLLYQKEAPAESFDPSSYNNLCPTSWYAYGASGDSAFSYSGSGNSVKVTLSKTGTNFWDVQARTNSTFSMTQGKTYRLMFDIVSTQSRTVRSAIQNNSTYASYYLTPEITLEANVSKSICYDFVMDTTTNEAYFDVNLGYFDSDANLGTHSVSISNIYIICLD